MTSRDARTLGVLAVTLAVVASVGAIPISATAPSDAAEPTPISDCTTIDESGTYLLTEDIDDGGGTPISQSCFEIRADDVTFDGNGHDVAGRGVSHTNGVAVLGAENVTVRNFEVHDWHNGVLVENGSASVHDVRSYGNAYGIRLVNASGTVADNSAEDNLVGIYVAGDVSLGDNDLSGNEISVKESGTKASSLALDL
jgi:parallel beta-helix repeat protein